MMDGKPMSAPPPDLFKLPYLTPEAIRQGRTGDLHPTLSRLDAGNKILVRAVKDWTRFLLPQALPRLRREGIR